MLYDIAHFWVALLGALVLGIAVGWFTRSDPPRHGSLLGPGRSWIVGGAVVFLVGLVLALLHAIPDRPGLWLETALLLVVAYLVGCPIPGLLPAGRRTAAAVGPGMRASALADVGVPLRPSATLAGSGDDPVIQDLAEPPSRRGAGTSIEGLALEAYLTGLRNQHAVETQAIGTIQNELPRTKAYPELHARMEEDKERSTRQAARLDALLAKHGTGKSLAKEAVTGAVATVAGFVHMPSGDDVVKNLLAAIGYKAYEIASYKVLLTLADAAGAGDDRAVLEQSMREEQEMGDWLGSHIPSIVQACVRERER